MQTRVNGVTIEIPTEIEDEDGQAYELVNRKKRGPIVARVIKPNRAGKKRRQKQMAVRVTNNGTHGSRMPSAPKQVPGESHGTQKPSVTRGTEATSQVKGIRASWILLTEGQAVVDPEAMEPKRPLVPESVNLSGMRAKLTSKSDLRWMRSATIRGR